MICCWLLGFPIDLSPGALITLVPLSFDISPFLGYRFLWLGCQRIFTMLFSFTSVDSWTLTWAGNCIFIPWGFNVLFCIFSNLFSNCMLSFWNFLINSTCDFLLSLDFLSCSLRSSLWFLMQLFSSCVSRSFPSMSFVECSSFDCFSTS